MENTTTQLSPQAKKQILKMQINELTEHYIYRNIAKQVRDTHNREILEKIGAEEKMHAAIWEDLTKTTVKPKKLKIIWITLLSRILGFTFALKLMENGETDAFTSYKGLADEVPAAKKIAEDEDRHEQELINLLDEERLQYVGSMVLGLNDALVELSGTLAGLTFALQNNRLVALSGLITGFAATLSMASSEYLSARSDGKENAFKSCLYTGFVYLLTVVLLVLPYLLLPDHAFVQAVIIMICTVVVIILLFTYYISVAKDLPFKRRFLEMAGISLSVAAISFGIGILVKLFLQIDV